MAVFSDLFGGVRSRSRGEGERDTTPVGVLFRRAGKPPFNRSPSFSIDRRANLGYFEIFPIFSILAFALACCVTCTDSRMKEKKKGGTRIDIESCYKRFLRYLTLYVRLDLHFFLDTRRLQLLLIFFLSERILGLRQLDSTR